MSKISRLLALLLSFSLVWTTSLQAWAAGPTQDNNPIFSALGFRSQDTILEKQFRTYLLGELEISKKVKLVPDAIVGPHVDEMWNSQRQEVSSGLDQAYQALFKGKKLYEALDVDEAIKSLSDSVRLYREAIGAIRDNRYLLAAHLYLGMALVIRGNQAEGKEFIRQMITLDPDRLKHHLAPKDFPPKIVAIHNQLIKEISTAPTGIISLRTTPLGAEVFLDGVAQVHTPVDLKVPVGEHFIVAQKRGYGRFSQRVVVREGRNSVEAQLQEWQPLAPYVLSKRSDPVSNDLLQRLGSSLGAPILMLGHLDGSNPKKVMASAQLYDTRSKEFSKIETIEVDSKKIKKSAEVLTQRVLKNLTIQGLVLAEISQETSVPTKPIQDHVVSSPVYSESNSLVEGEKPFYKKWWFWSVVGGVVLGGAGAAILFKPSANSHVLNIDNPLK